MKKFLISTAFLAFATAAIAQSATEKTGVNSALGIAPSVEDFVREASSSDVFEIESSKLALTRGDEATKAFAQQMITDHEKTSAELKQLVESGQVKATLDATTNSSHQTMLDDLKKLEGSEFVEQYKENQVSVHEDAVDLFKRYSQGGENPVLKAWTAKTLSALQHHLQVAEGLEK
ncbi:UNVERIFIED_ORG: putative membrane protein [Rhizobium nepotum]|nr:putative membrane protein [Rhizobium nepotum]